MAIPQGKQARGGADHQAEGAAAAAGGLANRRIPSQAAVHSVLERKGDQLGIGGGRELNFRRVGGNGLAQLPGVHQVAVVGQGKGALLGVEHHRLGIAGLAAAGGGVAVVADGQVAGEALEHVLVEHLAHQAHVLVEAHLVGRIEHGNARRLLAAVLQGVEAEVGEVGHRLALGQHRKHAAGLLRLVGALRHGIAGDPAGVGLHVGHGRSHLQVPFSIVHRRRPLRRWAADPRPCAAEWPAQSARAVGRSAAPGGHCRPG